MRLGVQELVIILLIVLVIFGPSQLPKLMRMFGKGVKSFKNAVEGKDDKEQAQEQKDKAEDKED